MTSGFTESQIYEGGQVRRETWALKRSTHAIGIQPNSIPDLISVLDTSISFWTSTSQSNSDRFDPAVNVNDFLVSIAVQNGACHVSQQLVTAI